MGGRLLPSVRDCRLMQTCKNVVILHWFDFEHKLFSQKGCNLQTMEYQLLIVKIVHPQHHGHQAQQLRLGPREEAEISEGQISKDERGSTGKSLRITTGREGGGQGQWEEEQEGGGRRPGKKLRRS